MLWRRLSDGLVGAQTARADSEANESAKVRRKRPERWVPGMGHTSRSELRAARAREAEAIPAGCIVPRWCKPAALSPRAGEPPPDVSESAPDPSLDDLGGPRVRLLDPVGVDVGGGRRVPMADSTGNAAQRHACVEQLGHLEVAQAVQVDPTR